MLRLHVGLANFPLKDIVEARVMLERGSVRLAAENASPADLDQLHDLVARMADPDVGRGDFNDLDTAFHVVMAAAAGNVLVRDITSAIRESLRHSLLDAFLVLDNWDEVADGLRADHRRILELVTSRDGSKAAEEVERHIRAFYAVMRR
jgi:GntR family transcriptional repressor for pyruvate dehydrogenase complex